MAADPERDIVRMIRQQHEQIRQLFADVGDAPAEQRQRAFEPLVRLLAVHETAEEEIVYPTLNLLDEDARAVARDRKAEEDQAKKALAHLEGLDASSSAFADVFEQFRLDVDRHAQQEETLVLPLLEQADDDERRSMGHAFAAAEALAPTHAHRMAPESAVGNLLVGPFVAMVDKVRDAVRDARRGGST